MIGRRFKQFREKKGLKTTDFAKKIGISQGSLSDIENGKTKPSADTLSSIVRHTDVNPLWLLTGEGEMERSQKWDIELAAESNAIYKTTTIEKIVKMLENMDEEQQRYILKNTETEKFLADLKRERKKAG